jgi:AMIN domain
MKFLPRIGCQALWISLLLGTLGAISSRAQSPADFPSLKHTSAAILRSVKVISDGEGPALEIISTRALHPTIQSLVSPPRLLIDLPGVQVPWPRKRVEPRSNQIRGFRVHQFQQTPVVRVVLDLVQPAGYGTEGRGERLLVRLYPLTEARQASPAPPSVTAFTAGVRPAVLPASPGSSGAIVEAGSPLAGDSAVTAGADATILHLTRGGEVRVCPGTTLSITASQNGHDLMLGMSTGAIEAHYALKASADSVVTPDFRMLLAGPGEFHYAFSADTRGNTCVRALRENTASVLVSELLGNGTYQVKPNEQIVFRAGRLSLMDASVPDDCGCPPPAIPALRAASAPAIAKKDLPHLVHLAPPGDRAKPMLAEPSRDGLTVRSAPSSQVTVTVFPTELARVRSAGRGVTRVQVDAPFVFRATDPATSPSPNPEAPVLPISPVASPAPLLTMPEPPPTETGRHNKGILGRFKSFLATIFR